MKIAIDVDGVITEAPSLFALLSRVLRAAGHEIHVLSDFDEQFRAYREQELAAYGVEYDRFVITGDKAGYCREHAIDFALDDDPTEYFPGATIAHLGIVSFTRR